MNNLDRYGEDIAIKYLRDKDYLVVESNYTCLFGEIDIVARKSDRYHFVEVKRKSSYSFGRPEEMLNYYKSQKLLRLAKNYLTKKCLEDVDWQIDLIAITDSDEIKIRYYQNVVQED